MMKTKRKIKPKDPFARAVSLDPAFRVRKISSKKKYKRKEKYRVEAD